jgi:hypothetical protein
MKRGVVLQSTIEGLLNQKQACRWLRAIA